MKTPLEIGNRKRLPNSTYWAVFLFRDLYALRINVFNTHVCSDKGNSSDSRTIMPRVRVVKKAYLKRRKRLNGGEGRRKLVGRRRKPKGRKKEAN